MISLTTLKIVFYALAISSALLVTVVWQRALSKKPVVVASSQQRFNQTWTDTIPVALKSDKITAITTFPKVVITERIAVSSPQPDTPVSAAPPDLNKPVARRKTTRDVCSRHGMVKVTHGKRWRCERRKRA